MAFVSAGYWDLDAAFPDRPRRSRATLVALDDRRVAHRARLRRLGPARQPPTWWCSTKRAAGALATASRARRGVHRAQRRREALPSRAEGAVHDLDAAAGGRPQAAPQRRAGDAAWRRASTSAATSPTCAPTPPPCRETALDRGPAPGSRALRRRRTCPTAPRIYARKVKNAQEAHEAIRPAGDSFRTPDSLGRRARRRRAAPLRPHLEAHRRLADGRRHAVSSVSVRLAATATDGRRRPFAASGRTITFPGYLRAYVEGADDPEAELDDRETLLPALAEGDALPAPELEAKGHTTQPAGALHRGVAGEAARGAGHRPAVHLRVDHADDPGPRLRVEEGHRARAHVDRVRGRQRCSSSTSPTSSTTPSPPAWRTTSTRSRRARSSASRGCATFWFGRPGVTDGSPDSRRSG